MENFALLTELRQICPKYCKAILHAQQINLSYYEFELISTYESQKERERTEVSINQICYVHMHK